MNFLDKNSSAVLRDAEGKLNLEEAKFDNQLLNENTEASINFLRTRNAALPQDASLNEILRQLISLLMKMVVKKLQTPKNL